MVKTFLAYLGCCAIFLSACQSPPASNQNTSISGNPVTLDLPAGFSAVELPYRFDRPTQFTLVGDFLWVAELNGGENDQQGRILRIDLTTGEELIVLEGLDKPTGLAVVDQTVWVATRDAILQFNVEEDLEPQVVIGDLPNNGRSNGTLTVTPQQTIIYETSGNRRDADSGKLWEFDPADGEHRQIAAGLKGGYAHAFDDQGRLWLTEIVDGSVDGVTLPDELNLWVEGADFGWPRCYGRELAGPDCAGVRPAVAVFEPHSTPTSVAISPFADQTLLVALWVSGEVVSVRVSETADNAVGEIAPFLTEIGNPQHLLTIADGSLLVSDYAVGRIYQITKDSSD